MKLYVQLLFAFNGDLLSAILDFSKLSRKHVFTTQILQISQIDCRNRRYRAITQIRDSEPPSQILQISQIDCRNPRYRGITQIKRLKTPIAEIADIAISQILEISQIYCRNRRIIQMRDREPTSQILQLPQILQISQMNCRNCRYRRIIQMRDSYICDICNGVASSLNFFSHRS